MDKLIMDFNVSSYDRLNRLVLGVFLLIAIMASDSIPAWLCLIPLYPILTAIMAWDPLFAILNLARGITTDKFTNKPTVLALG